MICFIVIVATAIVAFVIVWLCVDFIPNYIVERNHITYLKLRKEWLNNQHPCKYDKDNPFIKCHDKEGEEDCIHCPYIPFEEECKYYNI